MTSIILQRIDIDGMRDSEMTMGVNREGLMKPIILNFSLLSVLWVQSGLAGTTNQKDWDDASIRIKEIYSEVKDGDVMNVKIPKFQLKEGKWVPRERIEGVILNDLLRVDRSDTALTMGASHVDLMIPEKTRLERERFLKLLDENPLIEQAQAKSSDIYQRFICENFLSKQVQALQCHRWRDERGKPRPGMRAYYDEKFDNVNDLLSGWVSEPLRLSLDEIPDQGEVEVVPWSDDYWRMQWGGTAYRYGHGRTFESYLEAMNDYVPGVEWTQLLSGESDDKTFIDFLSPAEKYDLSVGDESFTLTQNERSIGEHYQKNYNRVEPWMGICHGWAPASFMSPRPLRSVEVTGSKGMPVTFHPHDIRALTSLAWANGEFETSFVGGRCDSQNIETYPNGRLKGKECFDVNPATFHFALGFFIGNLRKSFVMDKTFDYEVWNQPLRSYETIYFNPVTLKRSKDWYKVMVAYDNKSFKIKDRFRRKGMNTRGGDEGDKDIEYVVGAITTVEYIAESQPLHGKDTTAEDVVMKEIYTYDLELIQDPNVTRNQRKTRRDFIVRGGEWHHNNHPDFLFVPRPERDGDNVVLPVATSSIDYDSSLEYSLSDPPSQLLTSTVMGSSKKSYPICRVLKSLLEKSGDGSYRCPD